jgi:hypothetical protein
MPEVAPSRNTVTVACKVPGGLVLELDGVKKDSSIIAGRDVDVHFGTGQTVTIVGSNARHPDAANPGREVAGYGLTEVPADFWAKWVEQHKGFPLLEKGLLFAQPTEDRSASQAKEQTALKSGREGMDPDNPMPRVKRVPS